MLRFDEICLTEKCIGFEVSSGNEYWSFYSFDCSYKYVAKFNIG